MNRFFYFEFFVTIPKHPMQFLSNKYTWKDNKYVPFEFLFNYKIKLSEMVKTITLKFINRIGGISTEK